jgi:hypothetical protein
MGPQWYGYLHENGEAIVKYYIGDFLDIVECRSSPFVKVCFDPFEANDKAQAQIILQQKIDAL